MRTLLSIILILTTVSTLQGDVIFEFSYDDPPGVGLNDPANQEFKEGIEEAGCLLGSFFDHQATIQISVKAYPDDYRGYDYASMTAQYVSGEIVSFPSKGMGVIGPDGQVSIPTQILNAVELHNVVHKKIILGEDLNGLEVEDANLLVNPKLKDILSFDKHDTERKADFVAIIMHELTHALGFFSLVDSTLGIGFQYFNNGNIYYTAFDEYLINQRNAALVKDYLINHDMNDPYSVMYLASPGDSDFHYFNGPHAKEANSGNPIPIDTGRAEMIPNQSLRYSYTGGMAHIDIFRLESECTLPESPFENRVTTHMMQGSTNAFYEQLPRQWSPIEKGILKDLGYKIKGEMQEEDPDDSWRSWFLSWF